MGDWVLGEFGDEHGLLEAARELTKDGQAVETHSPFPLEGASEAVGLRRSKLAYVALVFGLGGAAAGYLIQWFANAVNWPLNVGGRPPHSAPAFIPITFESAVLICALSIFFGLWLLLGLPRPYHPVFESEAFRNASTNGLWLSVKVGAAWPGEKLADRLRALGARQVSIVSEQS